MRFGYGIAALLLAPRFATAAVKPPRYLRAMALLENTQKAGRGDPGIDTAPPDRNRALSSNALDPTNPLCGTLIRSVSAHFEVTKIRLNDDFLSEEGKVRDCITRVLPNSGPYFSS